MTRVAPLAEIAGEARRVVDALADLLDEAAASDVRDRIDSVAAALAAAPQVDGARH
ncbi:MAG TPA: hypothetical protein VMU94_10605 [Streptosporangiaceae bacterium]|nr:hypothetical protein [Streptosporangiaceae bacterium]